MVQLLNYREVFISNVVNPVEDLQGTVSNPGLWKLGSVNMEKNLQAGLDLQITPKCCRLP